MAQSNFSSEGGAEFLLPTEVAFAELLPEISAVPVDDLSTLNVDVVEVVTLVLGVLPELRELRPEIQEQLPRFNLDRYDRLEKYALALNHAHTLHRSKQADRGAVAELGAELVLIRDRLYASAMALASYDLLDAERLKDCKKESGYRATATDVFTLVAVFKESWSQVAGKTPVTLESLHDAGRRAVELLAAFGVREQGPVTTAEAARIRKQAFTLFSAAYDDARRAVAYLRPEPRTLNDIVPTFYASRGGSRRPAATTDSEPAASGTRASAAAAEEADMTMDNSAGLPVTKPFIN